MDAKDLLISVGELHSSMNDAHINAITTALVAKMRENIETMLPAFPFKDNKERQVFIERMLIAYEMGVKDGICGFMKSNKVAGIARKETINEVCEWLDNNKEKYQYKAPYNYFDMEQCIDDLKKHLDGKV